MRVDASQVLAGGGVIVKSGTSSVTDALKDGDETNIKAEDDLSVGEKSLVREFTDKSLAPYAAKLAELNMPVTEQSARAMRDIMSQNPKLSMDEAAFLASNKLTGDESLMKAALEVLSGGDKTDAMIAKLLSALENQGVNNPDMGLRSVSAQNTAPLTELITFIAKSVSELQTIITQPDSNMQLNVSNTESFFTQDVENALNNTQNTAQNTQNTGQIQQPAPQGEMPVQENVQSGAPATPAPQSEITMQPQSETVAPPQPPAEALQPQAQPPAQPPAEALRSDALTVSVSGQEVADLPKSEQPTGEMPVQDKPYENVDKQVQPQPLTSEEQQTQQTQQTQQPQQRPAPSVSNTVAELLSEVPEFKGTPHSALERFSNMLLRVAGDSAAATDEAALDKDTKMLAAQLDKMFTKIGRNDEGAGARLREAREELFARLSLVEEEISRSSGSARTDLLTQTQKLMDHVRLLNNIEQFLYMQLPVQLSEQRKSAELYVFKRKGGKKADPDNVNILLAIDLEFMGHWEALLNIKGKDVYINMEVQSEKEKEHFIENTVLLHEMLSEEGFKLVNTNIKISQEETTPLTALLAFDRYTGGHQGKIDFFH
ncbi:MAG: hypothetical protein FWD44_03835 [Oscillospiraceae bacterium]|nr:hypothetical protein [Oscillospiraceae bacterium]